MQCLEIHRLHRRSKEHSERHPSTTATPLHYTVTPKTSEYHQKYPDQWPMVTNGTEGIHWV